MYLLEFSRSPSSFLEALLNHAALQAVDFSGTASRTVQLLPGESSGSIESGSLVRGAMKMDMEVGKY